jgi:hypothetical protein
MTRWEKTVRTARVGALTLVGLWSLGCTSDKPLPAYDLLDTGAPKPQDLTIEQRRTHEMQLISVQLPSGDVERVELDDLTQLAFAQCTTEATQRIFGVASAECQPTSSTDCRGEICAAQRNLCMANQLLDLAVIRAEPVIFENGWRVFAQSNAVNAVFAHGSRDAAGVAMTQSAWALYDASVNGTPLGTSCGNADASTIDTYTLASGATQTERRATTLARTFAEALNVFREAANSQIGSTTAVSDAELNSGPRTVGIERSISNEELSRAHAARLLVGGGIYTLDEGGTYIGNGFPGYVAGKQGIPALPKGGFCSEPQLTSQAQAALSFLREAAPAPSSILNEEIKIGELLDDTGTAVVDENNEPVGSVRQRLADYWGPHLTSAPLTTQLNLESGDFVAARRFMAQEILAFSRSMTAKHLRHRADGSLTTYYGYGATEAQAEQPPDAYYAALARYHVQNKNYSTDGPLPGLPSLAGGFGDPNSLATGLDFAISYASAIASHSGGFYNQSTWNSVKDIIGMVAGMSDRPGRLRLCAWDATTSKVWAQGYLPTDKLLLVVGEDGLNCGVKGKVEGLDCSMQEHAVAVLSGTDTPDKGFAQAAFATWASKAAVDARYYLLKPKVGNPGVVECDTEDSNCIADLYPPGSYEALVGATIPAHHEALFGDSPFCAESPIVPEAEERAARVLAPNEDSCAHSRITCAKASFDERMPLENELSEDNDDVESSWKHYLALARQAADESDLLGEQYIEHGLAVDERDESVSIREEQKRQQVETVIDELQATCGTSMDTSSLLEFLSGESGDDLANFTLDACPCETGYKCISNVCVVDIAAKVKELGVAGNADMLRLAECIDPGGTEKLLHLGEKTATVCVWRGTGVDANEICKLPEDCSTATGVQKCKREAHPCPALPEVNKTVYGPGAGCLVAGRCTATELNCIHALGFGNASPAQLNTLGINVQPVTTGLNYFSLDAAEHQVASDVCESIRRNRTHPGSDIDGLQALVKSNLLHPLKAKDAARRLGFEARLGGFAALTVDGTAKFDTGSPWSGPAPSGWPCSGAASFADCEDDVGGLFCDLGKSCSNNAERAQLGARMLSAVVAARIMTEQVLRPLNDRGSPKTADEPLGIVLPYYGRFTAPTMSLRTVYTNGPVLFGRGSAPADHPFVGGVTVYQTDGVSALPIALYYDESGIAAPLSPAAGLRTYFNKYPGYTFMEFGVPRPPGVDVGGGLVALEGMSEGSTKLHNDGNLYNVLSGAAAFNSIDSFLSFPLYLTHQGWGVDADYVYGREWDTDSLDDSNVPVPVGASTFAYSRQELFDGLELLCEVGADSHKCDLASPPTVRDVGDLEKASRFLECAADTIRSRSAMTILANVPKRAIDALRTESVVGSFPALGGELGNAVSDIRTGLVSVARMAPLISNELIQLGHDIRTLQGMLAKSSIRDQISDLQFMSQTADRIAECGTIDVSTFGLNNVVKCANAAAQIQYASEINSLAAQDEELTRELTIQDFSAKFADRAKNMQGYALELVSAIENVDKGLLAFDSAQKKAERTVVRALYAASFHAKNELEISSVLRQRQRTAQLRYQEAHVNAIRMAFLAKRALELRLGVHLSDLTEDLPLVTAPATWESTLCSTSGVDYDKLREKLDDAPKDYADAYIGSYVTKLENLVESYRLQFGFHEGADVAVVSLKNDVMGIRAECDVASPNLLYHAGQIDEATATDAMEQFHWRVSGCRTDQTGAALADCISARPLPTAAFSGGLTGVSAATAYTVLFGTNGNYCSGAAVCGFQANAELVQTVELEPGRYRFSWYEGAPLSTQPIWVVRDQAGTISATAGTPVPASEGTWTRPFVTFDIDKKRLVTVGFKQPATNVASISLSAPMLEKVDDLRYDLVPGIFVNTQGTLVNRLAACEDTDGTVFRASAWRRNCEMLCKDGYSVDCGGGAAQKHCFREAKFSINQRALEAGQIFKSSGFARGNFNYRLNSLALNFVGTSTRDCAHSPTPSSCYGAGFIPYSIQHLGPYYVRNHLGQDFKAELFTGNIEHARGLATERYLTNPLSSTDRDLLQDYLRGELRGRPLDGNFVIRVWEEEGVDFDAIEDVQVVLNYRYWTRFD